MPQSLDSLRMLEVFKVFERQLQQLFDGRLFYFFVGVVACSQFGRQHAIVRKMCQATGRCGSGFFVTGITSSAQEWNLFFADMAYSLQRALATSVQIILTCAAKGTVKKMRCANIGSSMLVATCFDRATIND